MRRRVKNTSSQVVVFLFASHLYLASCWLCLCLVLALPTLSIIIIINIMANFASASFKCLFNLDFDLANNLCRVIKQLDKGENDRWGSQRNAEGVWLVMWHAAL